MRAIGDPGQAIGLRGDTKDIFLLQSAQQRGRQRHQQDRRERQQVARIEQEKQLLAEQRRAVQTIQKRSDIEQFGAMFQKSRTLLQDLEQLAL